jgi:hypothetical protein
VGDPLVARGTAVVADGHILAEPAGVVELDAVPGVLNWIRFRSISESRISAGIARWVIEEDAVPWSGVVAPARKIWLLTIAELLDRGVVLEVDVRGKSRQYAQLGAITLHVDHRRCCHR